MRALITGATGYIGSHLARYLCQGDWQVAALVRSSSLLKDLPEQVTTFVVNDEQATFHDIIREVKPDVVFHLASLFIAEHQSADVLKIVNSNILFGNQLVEAMVREGCRYLVNTGTAWQHYLNESERAANLYAATKIAFEKILDYYVDAWSLRVITLKIFESFGPFDPRKKLIPVILNAAKTNKPVNLTDGKQLLDYVYINDIRSAFFCAAKRLMKGDVTKHEHYGLSSGNPLSIKDIVAIIESVSSTTINSNWGVLPYRSRDVMKPWSEYDILPGWQPQISFAEGIKQIWKLECKGA